MKKVFYEIRQQIYNGQGCLTGQKTIAFVTDKDIAEYISNKWVGVFYIEHEVEVE